MTGFYSYFLGKAEQYGYTKTVSKFNLVIFYIPTYLNCSKKYIFYSIFLTPIPNKKDCDKFPEITLPHYNLIDSAVFLVTVNET